MIQALAEHATVILSTHIMQEVDAICDRALILRDGRLALDENLADLRAADHMLLKTSLDSEALVPLLADIEGVTESSRLQIDFDKHSYRVQLLPGSDADQVAAAIATRLSDAGAAIYQLSSAARDLESVFRDVNSAEETSHAA